MDDMITPDEVKEILHRAPMKMKLLDVDDYLNRNTLQYVTSPNIFEPNSSKFHPNGLFSEEIFGSVTSMERFTTEALINLNTTIIHPMIFASNIQPKNLYTTILAGKQYAVFDEESYSFKIADIHTEGAGTGFQFFISNFKKLADAPQPKALRASNLHKLLVKYKDNLTISKLICIPAGLRDLDLKSARLSKDDINKLYMTVINLASSLSGYTLSEDPIFDGIRYQLQLRVADVYDYITGIISGKGGFLQKHYGARKIAFSTRNVISVATNHGDVVDDPANIKSDETMVPMLNLIKCFQPFFTNYVLKKLYGELFVHGSTENVAVTNPETLSIEYVSLKPSEVNKYTTPEGANRIINQFKHVGFRESPISITDSRGKSFWLILVYIDMISSKVFLGKSLEDLIHLAERYNVTVNKKEVRALTWSEFMYIAGVQIADGKHGFITRYPVLGDGSIYPSKLHVITTDPSYKMEIIFDTGLVMNVPHYPALGSSYYESLVLHPSRLAGLGADMDGDMVSLSTLWTNESNDDIIANMNKPTSVIGQDMQLKLRADSDVVNLAIFNLSRQDLHE